MKIELKSGKYIVAVSGGVDSVVLLDLLCALPKMELVVAHFDHGIREDSAIDKKFVQNLAEKYSLSFEYAEGRLGPGASEATARAARYGFLEKVRGKLRADAVVTAHHEDDMLETAIINMLRGTGRKGLSALGSGGKLKRPLLHLSKQDIIEYAKSHDLEWREDSTNQDEVYLRNYIRQQLMPRFSETNKRELLSYVKQSKTTNEKLDDLLDEKLRRHSDGRRLDKQWFSRLPHDVALEVMATWLRHRGVRSFDRKTLERLAVAAKTGRPSQCFDVTRNVTMKVGKRDLALEATER